MISRRGGILSEDKTYNGWTNYATWRVNLEYFDGREWTEEYDKKPSGFDLADRMKDEVQEWIDESCSNTYVAGWAAAFVDEVNFDELADHVLEDWEEDEPEAETDAD
jgi:hypothetical protein